MDIRGPGLRLGVVPGSQRLLPGEFRQDRLGVVEHPGGFGEPGDLDGLQDREKKNHEFDGVRRVSLRTTRSTCSSGADTAQLSNDGGAVSLDNGTVTAVVDGLLPTDDIPDLAEIR